MSCILRSMKSRAFDRKRAFEPELLLCDQNKRGCFEVSCKEDIIC